MATKKKYALRYLPLFEEDLCNTVDYIANTLINPTAAENLLNNIEQAILERSKSPEGYEPYQSEKTRAYTYYRIYVGNYTIYYVLIDNVMEVHRLLYNRRNRDYILK